MKDLSDLSNQAKVSVAVLPFLNLGGDKAQEFLSDGFSEEIIHALTKVKGLRVTSRRSSFLFKDSKESLESIASKLGVDIIVEGSVFSQDGALRIKAQLIEAQEDYQLWSESWNRKRENIFELQDEIALSIADKLREQYGHLEYEDQLSEPISLSLSAYEHNLKARYYFNQWNPDSVRRAMDHWQEALKIDALMSEAHLGLADAYGFLATTQSEDFKETWRKAAYHTQEALRLNPKSAGVHYLLANQEFFTNANYSAAYKYALKAVEFDPQFPEGLQFLAFLNMLSGDLELAEGFLKRALDRDPFNSETLFYQAYYFYRKEEYAHAESLMNSLIDRNPQNLPALVCRCYVWMKQSKAGKVTELFQGAEAAIIPPGDVLGLQTLVAFMQGDSSYSSLWVELTNQAKDPMAFQQHIYVFLGLLQAGKLQEASECLTQIEAHKSSILLLAFGDPLAAPFKEHSDYQSWKKRLFGKSYPSKPENAKASLILPEELALYREQLEIIMRQEEPFLNPQLSLRSLSDQLQIPPNHLSWLLNTGFNLNFNQFVNSYRLARFKKLALDPANNHISIIGLAYESGFNSKTAFNTYFKREVGLSPKAWIDQQ